PLEVAVGFGKLRLRCRNGGLGAAQSIQLIVRLEFCDDLSGLDPVADIDRALGHPSGDAKRQTYLVLRLDPPRVAGGLADVALHPGDASDRSSLRRGALGFGLTGRQKNGRRQRGKWDAPPLARSIAAAEQTLHRTLRGYP